MQNLLGDIFGDLGIPDLSPEKKMNLIQLMTELLQKRVMLRALESMSEQDQLALELVENNPEEIIKFLQERVPNFLDIIQEEAIKVKEEMLQTKEQALS